MKDFIPGMLDPGISCQFTSFCGIGGIGGSTLETIRGKIKNDINIIEIIFITTIISRVRDNSIVRIRKLQNHHMV
jgi:hypothetical protein